MTDAINLLVQQFQNGQLSRREVVTGLAALFAAATGSAAQSPSPPVAARTLNHVSISVTDIKRSVDFYQSLFGMRIISQQGTGNNPIAGGDGSVVNLAPGAGPEFLGIYQGKPVGDIGHFCLGVQNFDADRVLAAIQGRRRQRVDPDTRAVEGNLPTDPDNISVQLTDATYCGGSGLLGNECK